MKSLLRYIFNTLKFFGGRTNYLRLPILSDRAIVVNPSKKSIQVFRVSSLIDVITLDHVFADEQYNINKLPQYTSLISRLNNDTPHVLDLGANMGYASSYFAQQLHSPKIIAIEPEQNNFSSAKFNLAHLNDCTVLRGAIGSESGTGEIKNNSASNNAFQICKSAQQFEKGFRIYSINEVMKIYGIDKFFLVKIDVEGSEHDLFSQNLEWIDKTDIIIIELHDWLLPFQNNSSNFLRAICNRNRDLIILGENLVSIKTDV